MFCLPGLIICTEPGVGATWWPQKPQRPEAPGALSLGTSPTFLWRTECFHYQVTININQERALHNEETQTQVNSGMGFRGNEWFMSIWNCAVNIALTNSYDRHCAYNKSGTSKAKLTGGFRRHRIDFGCEALRSRSSKNRFEELRIEAVILHSSDSAAEAKFLFHIRLHVSPRGWAVGQWHSSDIREWADDGQWHQMMVSDHWVPGVCCH